MNISSLNNPYIKTAFAVALGFAATAMAKKICSLWNNRSPEKPLQGFNLTKGETPEKVEKRDQLRIEKPVTSLQRYASIALGFVASATALYVSGVAGAGLASSLASRVSALRG